METTILFYAAEGGCFPLGVGATATCMVWMNTLNYSGI